MNNIERLARNELMRLSTFFSGSQAEDMIETAESGTLDEVRAYIYAAEQIMEAKNAIY